MKDAMGVRDRIFLKKGFINYENQISFSFSLREAEDACDEISKEYVLRSTWLIITFFKFKFYYKQLVKIHYLEMSNLLYGLSVAKIYGLDYVNDFQRK